MHDQMVVVEEQIDLVLDLGQVVDQCRNDRVRAREENLLQQIDRRFAEAAAGPPQHMGNVEQETCRLIIIGVERKPRDTMALSGASARPRRLPTTSCRSRPPP